MKYIKRSKKLLYPLTKSRMFSKRQTENIKEL